MDCIVHGATRVGHDWVTLIFSFSNLNQNLNHEFPWFSSLQMAACWISQTPWSSVSITMINLTLYLSIQFSCSVMSNSLWPNGLKHARLPCPSSTIRACTNSSPLSQWFLPTISSSGIPFSSCPQSFPASGSFKWVSSLNPVAKVLEFQLQHQSFQWIFRTDFL